MKDEWQAMNSDWWVTYCKVRRACRLSTHNSGDTEECPSVDEEIVPTPIDEKHDATQDDSHQSVLHQDAFDLVLHKEPNRLQKEYKVWQTINIYTQNLFII